MVDNQTFKACFQCSKRHIGCHSTCQDYLAEVEANKKRKEQERKEKNKGHNSGKDYYNY